MKDIHDDITHAKFGDDRLRGSGVVAGQISAFPIDFAGRPYNTLTLPCERVITASARCSLVVRCIIAFRASRIVPAKAKFADFMGRRVGPYIVLIVLLD